MKLSRVQVHNIKLLKNKSVSDVNLNTKQCKQNTTATEDCSTSENLHKQTEWTKTIIY